MSTKKSDSTEERVTPPSKLPDPTNILDPATDEKSVWTDAKVEPIQQVKSATTGRKAGFVTYRSRDEESVNINLVGVRPLRNPEYPGRHEWCLPMDLVDKADAHFHVRTGRIQKMTG